MNRLKKFISLQKSAFMLLNVKKLIDAFLVYIVLKFELKFLPRIVYR